MLKSRAVKLTLQAQLSPDGPFSLILNQVENGVAVLYLLAGGE
jgi:hypothetical protein